MNLAATTGYLCAPCGVSSEFAPPKSTKNNNIRSGCDALAALQHPFRKLDKRVDNGF